MKTISFTLILLLLGLSSTTGWAEDDPLGALAIDPNCLASSEVCLERAIEKEILRQRCLASPDWCEKRREYRRQKQGERATLHEQCKANPDQCDSLKQQFRKKQNNQKKQQKLKLKKDQAQWCNNNSARCEQWKADKKALELEYQKLRLQFEKKYLDRPAPY